jgi:Ca-activated chloride channel family protein
MRALYPLALSSWILLDACAKKQPVEAPVAPLATPVVASAAPVLPVAPRLDVDIATSPGLVRVDKDQDVFVRFRTKGLPLTEKKRPSLSVTLVVDTSGSMEGTAIEQARLACAAFVDLLSDGDSLAIVTFGSQPKVVVPASQVTSKGRTEAKNAIAAIRAEGTTDMTGGLTVGLQQARAIFRPEGINRIVLVGDGVPNDPPSALALADSAKANRLPITALGLGPDFDETQMTAIAQHSGGTFHFVDDAAKVAVVFKETITRMERLVAQNVWMQITPGPGVTLEEVVGAVPSTTGRGVIVQLGDVAEGQTRDVIVRMRAKGKKDGANIELVDALAHYRLPDGGGQDLTVSKFAALKATATEGLAKDSVVLELEHQATNLRVANGIVESMAAARNGDLPAAKKLIDTAIKLATEGAKRFDDKALGKKVEEMNKLRKTLPTLVPPPEPRESNMLVPPGGAGPARPDRAEAAAPRPAAAPAAKASPQESMDMRAAHGNAVKELQGL